MGACPSCDKSFDTLNSRKIYCSDYCRTRHYKELNAKVQTCKQCNTTFRNYKAKDFCCNQCKKNFTIAVIVSIYRIINSLTTKIAHAIVALYQPLYGYIPVNLAVSCNAFSPCCFFPSVFKSTATSERTEHFRIICTTKELSTFLTL